VEERTAEGACPGEETEGTPQPGGLRSAPQLQAPRAETIDADQSREPKTLALPLLSVIDSYTAVNSHVTCAVR
jgi:hypothetical protein